MGWEQIDKVIDIDQSPIGRTPRSNPATYTGMFDHIRKLFSQVPEARVRGYQPGRFSFNVRGGRCENCAGDGQIKIEMHFLPDVYVTCEVCKGHRYNRETLEVRYKNRSIADVLEMSVDEALEFFQNIPVIKRHLQTLSDVGLGYVKLGQPAPTLSGGEAQRIKLSSELQKRATGSTLYILDEPTTGLHFEDIRKLLSVLQRLVAQGNTVIVIEHNLDVVKTADWIVDLGPEGGDAGGEVIVAGSPEEVAAHPTSHTGQVPGGGARHAAARAGRRVAARPGVRPPGARHLARIAPAHAPGPPTEAAAARLRARHWCGGLRRTPDAFRGYRSGLRFLPEVADSLNDAGLYPSVVTNADGLPVVAYFGFEEALEKGEVPTTRPVGAPSIPGVFLATVSDQGYWTRGAIAMAAEIPNVSIPFDPAFEPSVADLTPENVTGLAMVADGDTYHAVWGSADGIYYATGSLDPATTTQAQVTQVTKTPGVGPSIALVGGQPWIAFYSSTSSAATVQLATPNGDRVVERHDRRCRRLRRVPDGRGRRRERARRRLLDGGTGSGWHRTTARTGS